MKSCNTCGLTKLVEEFAIQKTHRDGRSTKCKSCKNKHDRERYSSGVEKNRRVKLRYGISLAQYLAKYSSQDGKCAVCQKWFEVLCIDHDHKTKIVRDLLCKTCNLALGNVLEDSAIATGLADYINRHQR